MSSPTSPSRGSNSLFAATTAIVALLCCAPGPVFIGAGAWGLIGGWLGVACAVALAAAAGLLWHHWRGKRGC